MARSTVGNVLRLLGFLSQFLTFAGFIVIVAGLASLQKTTNALGSNLPAEIVAAYEKTFNQALLQPYPFEHGFQFSFFWFIIFLQLGIFLFTLLLIVLPSLQPAGRSAALTLLAIASTLTVNAINSLTFVHKNAVAKSVYGLRDIDITLGGALIVVVANGLTILSIGIHAPEEAVHTHHDLPKPV